MIGWGDSLIMGTWGTKSCVSYARQPSLVPAVELTGTCELDLIGAHYRTSVMNLAVGASRLMGDPAGGINRYNHPYTCPVNVQPPSPTSGLVGPCLGVLPALDSVVSPKTWILWEYSGINDAGAAPKTVLYDQFLSETITAARDVIAHGQRANRIVFIGPPKGNGVPFELNYLCYAAALKNAASMLGATYVDEWTPFVAAESADPSAVLFDSIHPNDAGAALWAKTVEDALH